MSRNYCHDIGSLMSEFNIKYKNAFRYNGNTYTSLAVAHSVHMKQNFIEN